LFVHETKETLGLFVLKHPTLQYRYCHGKTKADPMTVRKEEMDKFIFAVSNAETSLYYKPGELTAAMYYGKKERMVGGLFNELEGHLLSVKGMRKRWDYSRIA